MADLDKLTSDQLTLSLPTLDKMFPPKGPSLVKSFSVFSLFKSTSAKPTRPTIDILDPLWKAWADDQPSEKDTVLALTALSTYLCRLRQYTQDAQDDCDCSMTLLAYALKGYLNAFGFVTRLVWDPQADLTRADDLAASLETLLMGTLATYRYLTSAQDHKQGVEIRDIIDQCRLALLASTFTPSTHHPHNQLIPLFEHSRYLVLSLQVASRPLAHSKALPRTSLPPHVEVSDKDALHVMHLLEVFARESDQIEKLQGLGASKTKAQKEEDCRRPLRIGVEAWVLRCDLGLSMATRDIKAVKKRALASLARQSVDAKTDRESEEDEDVKYSESDTEEDGQGHKWEAIGEQALIDCLGVARALMEVRRGGVLSDKVERHDWLAQEIPASCRLSGSPLPPKRVDKDSDEDDDPSESDEESEDDDTVDAYPCPLRTLFRLHDRYEEQRLAIWLSLPQDKRSGMGTYMRGEEGKVGEAWDALGLLLLLDYDSEALLSHGLGGDKLDKWIELASVRNSKRIRRRGRKTV